MKPLSLRSGRSGKWARHRQRLAMCALAAALVPARLVMAQSDQGYIISTAPYPVFTYPEAAQYNLKWGKLTARLRASVQAEYNDNISLLDEGPDGDFSFGPDIGVGFLWPLSREHVLQLDFGFGYRWYMNHPSIQTVRLAPNSRIDYRIFIKDVKINLHESLTIQSDPILRPQLSGADRDAEEFQLLSNTTGGMAEWRPVLALGLLAGYDFTIERSLNAAFDSIDRNGHTFSGGAQYTFSPRLTGGLSVSYAITDYLLGVHNDAVMYGIGPVFTYELSSFISIDAAVTYTVATFENTGSVGDRSDYSGFTAQLGVKHQLNRRITQDVRLRKGLELGFGSNYIDLFSVQHALNLELTSAITLHSRFVYEHLQTSNRGGEMADRYLYYLGTSYQLTRVWSAAAAYAFAWKGSDVPERDYRQNRITLELSRRF